MSTRTVAPRDQVEAHLALTRQARRDPTYFSRTVLGHDLWSKQVEVKRSARANRVTLVRSAHGTGKSHSMADMALEFGACPRAWFPNLPRDFSLRIVATASTNPQVHDVLWGEVRRQYYRARINIGGEMQQRGWKIGPGRGAITASVDDPTALQGKHADAVLILVDEGEGLSKAEFDALNSLMSGENCRMVIAYNPVKSGGPCYEMSQRPDLCNVVHISALDHPNVVEGREVIPGAVTKTWVDEVRRSEGEGSAYWQSRVLGEHPDEGSQQIVTTAMLAQKAEGVQLARQERPRAGVDIARFGTDRNVMAIYDAHRNLNHVETWSGLDLMQSAGRVRQMAEEHDLEAEDIRIDSIGVGAGVVDRLHEANFPVEAVDFAAAPQGDWPDLLAPDMRFKNRRAELHWVFRRLLMEGALSIPDRFREVWADLVAPTYDYDPMGRLYVEKKDDIRKRLGRSPDFGDAAILAMSNASGGPGVWVL